MTFARIHTHAHVLIVSIAHVTRRSESAAICLDGLFMCILCVNSTDAEPARQVKEREVLRMVANSFGAEYLVDHLDCVCKSHLKHLHTLLCCALEKCFSWGLCCVVFRMFQFQRLLGSAGESLGYALCRMCVVCIAQSCLY